MAKKSTFKSNWQKYLLQWGTLAALIFFVSGLATLLFPKMEVSDPERYCPFGGLEALATYLANDTLPCSMTSVQIVMGIALAAAIMLAGKLFCGYLCPIGTIEDLLKKLRETIGLKSISIRNGSALDKILRLVKYLLLFYIFYMTMTASELFCKNLDPYYAVATGFKGEITLWMSITTLTLVILGGFLVDRFWCKYICPLGAISNSLKFWVWQAFLVGIWWGLNLLGVHLAWIWLLGAICVLDYLLEIFCGRRTPVIMSVITNRSKCSGNCRMCQKHCPYNIDLPSYSGKVKSVDCTLCGECIAACPHKALSIGVVPEVESKYSRLTRYIPALLAVLFVVLAFVFSNKFEVPTIDESWDITPECKIETLKVEGLKSVKCYSSSKAFKARMQKVAGVHGVKTYVGSHTVVISYDTNVTDEDKIMSQIFVPSKFRVNSLEPSAYDSLKCVTIRTERMFDKLDLNYLGMQLRATDKRIYGLESMYDCPMIVKVYMAPDEEVDSDWFKQMVEKKTLEMPVHGGGVNVIKLGFKYVRMEEGSTMIATPEYLKMMFDSFKAEYGRTSDGKEEFYYELADPNYEKPIVKRGLPFLSNHISRFEGVLGTYLTLNDSLQPCIRIRFCAPMTADRLWELITMDTWTITYKKDDVREEPAKLSFETPGVTLKVKR